MQSVSLYSIVYRTVLRVKSDSELKIECVRPRGLLHQLASNALYIFFHVNDVVDERAFIFELEMFYIC